MVAILTDHAEMIVAYTPIFFLSIGSGIAGLIRRRKITRWDFMEVITGYGFLGVSTFILLSEFYDEFSIEIRYAIIVVISYFGLDDALDFIKKMQNLKRRNEL